MPAGTASSLVTVGGASLPLPDATDLCRRYLNGVDGTYAYPYYDRLDTGSGPGLTDGDLLAPTLLNVPPTIQAFATLQGLRPELERALDRVPGGVDLVEADDLVVAAVADCFAVLDAGPTPGVRGVTLAKVLHRKRPQLIPLYDRYVYHCYALASDAPIEPDRGRSWRDFLHELGLAMRTELRAATDTWDELRDLGPHGSVSRLRALDIIAWSVGRAAGVKESDAPE